MDWHYKYPEAWDEPPEPCFAPQLDPWWWERCLGTPPSHMLGYCGNTPGGGHGGPNRFEGYFKAADLFWTVEPLHEPWEGPGYIVTGVSYHWMCYTNDEDGDLVLHYHHGDEIAGHHHWVYEPSPPPGP